MKRRSFIKSSCLLCAGLTAGASVLTLLEGCATAKVQKVAVVNKLINIDAALCNELQKVLVLRTDDLEYDVLLYYVSNANYSAVLLKCTHYDNPVFVNNKEVFCPSHGSKFDYTGKVLTEPATQSLKAFKTSFVNNTISIQIQP
jgi:Rieske Fe-S protein